MCACVCVRACARAYACERACVRACVGVFLFSFRFFISFVCDTYKSSSELISSEQERAVLNCKVCFYISVVHYSFRPLRKANPAEIL